METVNESENESISCQAQCSDGKQHMKR